MAERNKVVAWKADGVRGRRIAKKQNRKFNRRQKNKILKKIKEILRNPIDK